MDTICFGDDEEGFVPIGYDAVWRFENVYLHAHAPSLFLLVGLLWGRRRRQPNHFHTALGTPLYIQLRTYKIHTYLVPFAFLVYFRSCWLHAYVLWYFLFHVSVCTTLVFWFEGRDISIYITLYVLYF